MERDKLIEKIENAIDTENTMTFCLSRLAELVKNGRIKKKFFSLSESAKTNRDLLMRFLKKLEVNDFVLENKCQFCKINTESFSLVGALNLGLEIANTAIKFYKDLLENTPDPEDKKFFKKLIDEKIEESIVLKKEKGFVRPEKDESNLIEYHCITQVISELWK